MDIFNLIAGVCSIISLFLTIFLTTKVIRISAKFSVENDVIKNNKMKDNNTIVGGNYDGFKHK